MSQTALPSFETILLDLQDGLATITLNKPERLNAASPQMADEIGQALEALVGAGARALLMTGAGRAFCSGADLQGRAAAASEAETVSRGTRSFNSLSNHYNPTMRKLAQLPIPVVTAVNGPAAGIGSALALTADFTLAGRSAYFLQAFVNIGLVPDGGSTWLLPRLVGKARAAQMMMLGERIGAEQAEAWGLIYKAVDDAELVSQAQALAQRLANGPTVALGLMRRGLALSMDQSYDEVLATEARHQQVAGDSADAAEGGAAFLQRRKAEFKGR